MAAEFREFLFQEQFNRTWNQIENCKFSPAPYDEHINTGYLFLSKRDGTQEYKELSNDLLRLGFYLDSNKFERISLTKTDLVKYTDEVETIIGATGSENTVMYDIKGSPSGTLKTSGVATSGDATTITDTSKSWTINELAGSYIWITSGNGIGDIHVIISNTSDTITVGGWTSGANPSSGSTYRVYSLLSNKSVIISNETGTFVYDGNSLVPSGVSQFEKVVEYDGRMWYITSGKKSVLSYSYTGQPFAIDSFIDTGFGDIIDIETFGEYLIIGKEDSVSAIKKDSITEGVTVYSFINLVTGSGIISKGAMKAFSQGFYYISGDFDLYSLNIIVEQTGDIKGDYSSQGKVLRNYLNGIQPTYNYNMFNFKGDLHICISSDSNTVEFVYNVDNKGWLVNKYDFPIKHNIVSDGIVFKTVGNKVCYSGGTKDLGVDFIQYVGLIFGVDSQFFLKRIDHIKYLLGVIEDTRVAVKINPYLAFGDFSSSLKEFNVRSLMNSMLDTDLSTFGSSKFGDNPFGGGEERETPQVVYVMDKVGNKKNGHIFQIVITDRGESEKGFSLGGVFVHYNVEFAHVHTPTAVMS